MIGGAGSGGRSKPKLVVGIGASAGGLEACQKFLRAMPADSGIAFVIVMHLDPSRESHIVELFRKTTEMDVVQVTEPKTLEPDRVYVIAPATSLEIRDGVLRPTEPSDPRGHRKPVDDLFRSLAKEQKERAVAVVLSGAGDNGSSALRDIEAGGGFCLAQDPETAAYDSMPRNAIETGAVHAVLPPEAMPKVLVEYASHPGSLPERRGADRRPEPEPSDAFDGILELLGRTYGVNFRASYKRGTLGRRTERRMGLKQVSDWKAYLEILRADPKELAALYGDVLIGVTQFFRDPELWRILETELLPDLLGRNEAGMPVKIWVPGCATGEEAYSLAILFLEELERVDRSAKLQVFASDVAEEALAFARRGRFPSSIEETVSTERLSRFFRREGDGFEINRDVREVVTFAVHNLLSDPPFSRLDLVSCRNVLIYLEPHAQQRILEVLHFALKPGGFLVLGSSETVGSHGNLFETVSQKSRIYRSVAIAASERHRHLGWTAERAPSRGVDATRDRAPKGPNVSRAIEHVVLSRYTWATVAVGESLEIQSFFGPTHDYLTQPTGEARMDLLAWAKPGIYPRLRSALEKAREGKERVSVTGMRVERGEESVPVACTIEPVTPLPGEARMFLVSFRDVPRAPAAERKGEGAAASEEPLVRQLEAELKGTREELQGTIEQLEGANEEYQASHEELLSLNEELQSNNEELESSKEELQSLNEEMATINRQLEDKNVELRRLGTDLNNLLVSTEIPILFLSRDLRIRRFTPAATELLRLVPSDVGRSIEHVKMRFHDERLEGDAGKVLDELVPIAREVESEAGRVYTRSIHPYRTEDDRIDGVIVAFHDVTARKKAVRESEEARLYAEAIVATTHSALVILESDMRVVSANRAFYESFHVAPPETEGVSLYELGHHHWDIPGLRALLENVLPDETEVRNYLVEHEFEQIGLRTMKLNARRLPLADRSLILLAIEDVTEQRRAHHVTEARAVELAKENQRRDDFLAMLGHELRNPLAGVMHGLDLMQATREDPARFERLHAMMARQAGRMHRILDQILDLARLTAGKIRIARLPVDLAEAMEGAVEAVTPAAEEKKHELSVSNSRRGHAIVEGDLSQLTQVVENLMSNAIKYTEEGGTIELSLESDDTSARIRIKDDGLGMEPELVPHIFEPFTQAPRTLDRSAGGLGLGLPLVERVVEAHGGTVTASSPGLGQGSEFVVTLPLMSERRADEGTESEESGAGASPGKVRPRRILIVDDEEDSANTFAETLAARGHESRAVHDGPSALAAAPSFRPDVVLLDLGLPRMDGYEVARRLREQRGDGGFLLIAVTGYQEDARRLKDAGFDRHLIKPPDLEKLSRWLAEREKAGGGGA